MEFIMMVIFTTLGMGVQSIDTAKGQMNLQMKNLAVNAVLGTELFTN